MIHDRAYNREKTFTKAIRKRNIDRDRAAGRWDLYYTNLHQYANNKIHCSCPLCRAKTNANTVNGYSIRDQRRLEDLQEQENEI